MNTWMMWWFGIILMLENLSKNTYTYYNKILYFLISLNYILYMQLFYSVDVFVECVKVLVIVRIRQWVKPGMKKPIVLKIKYDYLHHQNQGKDKQSISLWCIWVMISVKCSENGNFKSKITCFLLKCKSSDTEIK